MGDRRLAQKLGSLFTVSTYRTIDEDAAFGIRQLVDVAVKALSPGINDTTTALTCIDYLGAILSRAASRRVELPDRDSDGVVRLLHAGPTFENLLHLAFDEIRWNSDGKVGVLARQLETLATVARSTSSDTRRRQIGRELGLIHDLTRGSVEAGPDRDYLDRLAAQGWEAVAGRGVPGRPDGDGPQG